MVPTLFGISLILWIVMVSAPGRPRGESRAFGTEEATRAAAADVAKGESDFIFRRQFALDRPVFWNGWTGLEVAEVEEALETSGAPIADVGAKAKRVAEERLEDWGTYAVPSLVALLDRTTGERQDAVQYWLR